MNYNNIEISYHDKVAVLTINRPKFLNALNSELFHEFNDFLDHLAPKKEYKVLVITGKEKAFVAGADISEMSEMNAEQAFNFSLKGQETFLRLEEMEIPVIAAVNGFALGGGCELAMACDFRIASLSAKFGQPEISLGLIPGYAGTQRFSRLTNLGNALYMILTGGMIDANEALRIGLVQKVCEPEKLMDEVMTIAGKIAANGSYAASKIKKVIRKGLEMDFESASQLECDEFSDLFTYELTHEGMKAFLEKRKPNW